MQGISSAIIFNPCVHDIGSGSGNSFHDCNIHSPFDTAVPGTRVSACIMERYPYGANRIVDPVMYLFETITDKERAPVLLSVHLWVYAGFFNTM